jgi:biotin carboxylase
MSDDTTTRARKRVLALGAKMDERTMFEKADALGIDVVQIQKPHLADARQRGTLEVHLLDYADHERLMPLVRAMHAAQPFDALICLTEPGLPTAAKVAIELGLRFTRPSTVQLLKDKWAMRQLLAAHGVSPVRAAAGTTLAEIEAFLRDVSSPAILKPIDGGGSFGIALVSSPEEAALALERLNGLGVRSFIIEEYLSGPEISVEAFSFAGKHVVVACTDKLTTEHEGFLELGHSVPAQLDPALRAEVVALTTRLLEVVKYTDGPSHTEIKLTPQGPRIIEGHDRLGGDHINELVRLAYGVDLVSTTFAWACGTIEPFEAPAAVGGAAVRFFIPPAGTLRSVDGLDELRAKPDVVELDWTVPAGGTIPRTRDNNNGRPGYVLVAAADAPSAAAAAARYAESVRVVVDPEPAP